MKNIDVRYGNFFKVPRKIAKYTLNFLYPLVIRVWPLPKVQSIEHTILKLINDKCSIVRFGDGEILYVVDKLNLPFQRYDERLASRFKQIFVSNHPKILVGLPLGYRTVRDFKKDIRLFWRSQIAWTYPRIYKYLDINKEYFNANITRLYYGFQDSTQSNRYFEMMKKLWENREIILIEGEKSRLGTGNDLFGSAISIERIIAPAHNAFDKYDLLLAEAIKHEKRKLILVALGPTAKPLVYDLANAGFQAIDIGNLDIEYEWFKMGTDTRVKIKGKYTSEVAGGRIVDDINDSLYESQIISKFI